MYRTVTAEKLSNDGLDCVWTINKIEVLFSCALLKHDKLKHCAGNKLSFYYTKETLCCCEKKKLNHFISCSFLVHCLREMADSNITRIIIGYYYFLGETFVTRKITRAVAKIHLGLQDKVRK